MKKNSELMFTKIYLIDKNKVLVKKFNNVFQIPEMGEIAEKNCLHLQPMPGEDHLMIAALRKNTIIPPEFNWELIKLVCRNSRNKELQKSGLAAQFLNWDLQTVYCGQCGSKTEYNIHERSKKCPNCGLINYPRISPAIIVAIVKEDKLLLAHNRDFPENLYSVIAGFLNPGETLEECVAREVREEVGINIKEIKYFGNQPWPYPDSQMIAFTAQYDSGNILEDNDEILHADWYEADKLPHVPTTGSISRKLIDWFVESYGKWK